MINKYISQNIQSSRDRILSLIDIEKAYMNTNHLDFSDKYATQHCFNILGSYRFYPFRTDEKSEDVYQFGATPISIANEKTEKELHKEAIDMYKKLMVYMKNVKKNFQDMVPKAITYYIIKNLVHYITHDVLFDSTAIPAVDYVSVRFNLRIVSIEILSISFF